MSDDDDSFAARRRRRQQRQDSDEDAPSSIAARRRRQQDSDEEESPISTFERKASSEEEEEEEEESTPAVVSNHVSANAPGTAFSKLPEAKRKKIQQQLIEGMFKYAESKYGRKRTVKGDKQNAMEDYDLYLRSIKAKVKAATDKHNSELKKKKDIDAKVAAAEKELQLLQSKYDKADDEKNNAINEGRDPVLPKDFIVPQRAKKASAGLGALVMKASSQMWEDKFSAMRSKKTSSNTPEWLAKQKKSDKTHAILAVGKTKKKTTEKEVSFGAKALKKSDGGRRRRKDDEPPPNPFKVNLKKTGLRQEDEEEKKPVKKTFTKKEPSVESEPEPEPEKEPEPEPEHEPEPEPEPEPAKVIFDPEPDEDDMPIRRRRVRRVYDSDEDGF